MREEKKCRFLAVLPLPLICWLSWLWGKTKLTSDILAGSVGVNPVIIRKTLSQLKNAGMITVARGTGGAEIAKDLKDISLLDVYSAVECLGKSGQLFSFHDKPNPDCPIGKNIHNVLDDRLAAIQAAMEAELAQTSLDEVVAATEKEIKEQSVSQWAGCFFVKNFPRCNCWHYIKMCYTNKCNKNNYNLK